MNEEKLLESVSESVPVCKFVQSVFYTPVGKPFLFLDNSRLLLRAVVILLLKK